MLKTKNNKIVTQTPQDPYQMPNPYESSRQQAGLLRSNSRERYVPYEDFETATKAKTWKQLLIGFVCAVGVVLLYVALSFFSAESVPDISAYADRPITVAGLQEEEFFITAQDILALDCEWNSATGKGSGDAGESKAGTVTFYGPSLRVFLAHYGAELEDFEKVKFFCNDGYSVAFKVADITKEMYLSIADGLEPLNENQAPLRLIALGQDTGMWAYGVERIEFTKADTSSKDCLLDEEGNKEAHNE